MLIALKEKDQIIALFTSEKKEELDNKNFFIEGKIEYIVYFNNKEDYKTLFFAEITVKWDGCSHFYFKGEDLDKENPGYYHICGISEYEKHMQMMWFAFKILTMYSRSVDGGEDSSFSKLSQNNMFQELDVIELK